MSLWLWQFWMYSFFGYLLEKGFAAVTHAEKQTRKCFLISPLCPVYGLGVLAALMLPVSMTDGFWELAMWGAVVATAVEYAVHWVYERVFHVHFWDYSAVFGNIRGRVCLPFSVVWGLLIALLLPWVATPLETLAAQVPVGVSYAALLLFAADGVLSVRILQRYGDTELLSLRRLLTD